MLYALLMYPLAYFYRRGSDVSAVIFGLGNADFCRPCLLRMPTAPPVAHRTAARETPILGRVLAGAVADVPAVRLPAGAAGHVAVDGVAHFRRLVRAGPLRNAGPGAQRQPGFAGWPGRGVPAALRQFLPAGAHSVFCAAKTGLHGRIKVRKALRVLATAALTLALCGTAWGLLAAADANFAALGQSVADWWNSLLNNIKYIDTLMYILLSLPVGAWLYGLVFGALRRTEPPTTAAQCTAALEHARIVPRSTATVAVAALCGVYALFFAVQAGEWFAAAPLGLSAPDAAAFAVDGFWQRQKILLLNFGVLAGVHFLGRRTAAQSAGRGVLRLRAGVCRAGGGAGSRCRPLRPDAPGASLPGGSSACWRSGGVLARRRGCSAPSRRRISPFWCWWSALRCWPA